MTWMSQDCHRAEHEGLAGWAMGHYGRQACPDDESYNIDYQYNKPISFVTDDEVHLGVDGPFWSGHWALDTVGF